MHREACGTNQDSCVGATAPACEELPEPLNTATPNFQNVPMTKDRLIRMAFLSFAVQANDPFLSTKCPLTLASPVGAQMSEQKRVIFFLFYIFHAEDTV